LAFDLAKRRGVRRLAPLFDPSDIHYSPELPTPTAPPPIPKTLAFSRLNPASIPPCDSGEASKSHPVSPQISVSLCLCGSHSPPQSFFRNPKGWHTYSWWVRTALATTPTGHDPKKPVHPEGMPTEPWQG
jgi:hypothetical protein